MARCGTSEGDGLWCNSSDTPGLVMASVAWIVMLFCDFAFSFLVLEFSWGSAGITVVALYNVLVVLSLWSHLKTMLTDPGSVPHCSRPLASAREAGIPETICGRCDAYKPPRSHHCRICNRCIVRMDHHCPWMNNCIGAGNQKHFILFLVYTWAQCTSALVMLVVRLSTCEASVSDCFPGVEGHLAVSMAVFSILALVFVTSMLYNQTYAVLTGIGTIDRMKRHTRHVNHKPVRWMDVFGKDMWVWWLLPTDMTFENDQEVLGYTTQKTKASSWSIHSEEAPEDVHTPVHGDGEQVDPPSDSADAPEGDGGEEDESVPGEEKVPLNNTV